MNWIKMIVMDSAMGGLVALGVLGYVPLGVSEWLILLLNVPTILVLVVVLSNAPVSPARLAVLLGVLKVVVERNDTAYRVYDVVTDLAFLGVFLINGGRIGVLGMCIGMGLKHYLYGDRFIANATKQLDKAIVFLKEQKHEADA